VPLVLERIPLRWSAGDPLFLLVEALQDFEPIASRVLLGALADLMVAVRALNEGRCAMVVLFSLVDSCWGARTEPDLSPWSMLLVNRTLA
jgi:hypothetical protein